MSGPVYADPMPPPPPASDVAPQAKKGNGFAVAALIFGIFGLGCLSLLGLVFGFLGLSRAKKVGQGKGMSIIGLVLSILWIVGQGVAGALVVPNLIKAADPGCRAAKAFITDDAKMKIDTSSPTAAKASLKRIVDELNADAAKANDPAAKSAISALATDFTQLGDALENGSGSTDALEAKVTADGDAIDKACGTIGS